MLGIGVGVTWLALSQYTASLASTDTALRRESQIVYYSIKNLMLPGEAPIARSFLGDIQLNAALSFELSLYRRNGVQAFVDNQTLRTVNANNLPRNAKEFPLRAEPTPKPEQVDPDEVGFWQAAGSGLESVAQSTESGRVLRILYSPLPNAPPCAQCHGSDHSVRGVIEITSDLTDQLAGARSSLALAGGFFLAMVTILTLVLTQFLNRNVIRPVKRIAEVCSAVTAGVFDRKVQTRSRDEIGELGRTVNQMVEGLHERFELSRYVSDTTIRSLRGSARGSRQPITILFSDVRGFTTFSEGREPEVVVSYLNRMLGAQTEIVHTNGGDVDKYVGDQVMALYTGEDREMAACRSALQIQAAMAQGREEAYGGLTVGIGIDTGEVVLGRIGSERRADFTVIGDRVNLAARLCSAARPGMVVISEAVYQAVANRVRVRGPFEVPVKGKSRPQRIYVLKGIR